MTELQLHNTLTKKKEVFTPANPGKVSMYTCGPTVYDYMTIGNIRSYTTSDILHRHLKYLGYEVRLIKNITDVGHLTDDDVAQGDSGEDKMLKKARLEKKDPFEIARFYENAAAEDDRELNILPAQYHPRATEHIPQMIKMIEDLLASGHAYICDDADNGHVFFDVSSFENYGRLSGNTLENLKTGARLEDPMHCKRNQWDFALWLKAPKEHLMRWESPWGHGYPGWHIECSAMSTEYLGDTIDIHTGGEDNIFPHHEAEIAQTESVTHKPFSKYWIHTRHLLIDGGRMGKSKGNAYVLADVKSKDFSALDLRLVYLLSHYRSQMNFTWESLAQAKSNRETLQNFFWNIQSHTPTSDEDAAINVADYKTKFDAAMNDDLNTPQALKVIFDLIKDTQSAIHKDKKIDQKATLTFFTEAVVNVFGITLVEKESAPSEITKLAEDRVLARVEKDFQKSDELRDQISELGYTIEDTAEGFNLSKK